MDIEFVWMLIFGIFVTIIFIVGVYYTISEIKSLREPEQRKEYDEGQGTKIESKDKSERR